MRQVLTTYEGSKAGTSHDIIRGEDGVVYCTCWAWKRNRRCKHLDRYFSTHSQRDKYVEAMKPIPVVETCSTGAMRTADDVFKAIPPTMWSVEKGNDNGVS